MNKTFVNQELKNGIATITFQTPAHNSMPSPVLKKLAQCITNTGKNAAVKVIILQSGGDRTFCAGASFDELIQINDSHSGTLFFNGFATVLNAMRCCPKLIIGRVQGKAVGGGVGLIAACDYSYATQYAAIKLSELSIGIGPFVIEPAVSRKIGKIAMSDMTLNATTFFAPSWAKDKGLYGQVFENATAMDIAIHELATTLSSYNPEAVAQMKKVLWEDTHHWETLLPQRAEISGKLVLSEFTKQKLSAYKK